MKLRDSVKNHFTFTVKEQRGIWVLSVLILILILIRMGVTSFSVSSPYDFSAFDEKVKLLESLSDDSINQDTASDVNTVGLQIPFSKKRPAGSISGTTSGQKRADPLPIIELNSADSLSLVMLKGIGPVLTARIMKYRELLGGYCDVNQLGEVFGMDTITLRTIRPFLKVDASVIRTIDLNGSSFKTLLRHPYLEYEHVKLIVKYRDKTGGFKFLDELYHIEGLDNSLIKRMIPYLKIQPQDQ